MANQLLARRKTIKVNLSEIISNLPTHPPKHEYERHIYKSTIQQAELEIKLPKPYKIFECKHPGKCKIVAAAIYHGQGCLYETDNATCICQVPEIGDIMKVCCCEYKFRIKPEITARLAEERVLVNNLVTTISKKGVKREILTTFAMLHMELLARMKPREMDKRLWRNIMVPMLLLDFRKKYFETFISLGMAVYSYKRNPAYTSILGNRTDQCLKLTEVKNGTLIEEDDILIYREPIYKYDKKDQDHLRQLLEGRKEKNYEDSNMSSWLTEYGKKI